MIINDNEVNHLFLKGQQFDSTEVIGKEVKFLKEFRTNYALAPDGKLYNNGSASVYEAGTTGFVILAQAMDCFYVANPKIGVMSDIKSGWVQASDVSIL
ncbi:hypothetical protein [Lactobacillus huangpiensis]|uniref:hypothetical protein n=1 Tax=Lactobacillus huangpiensis TaxID=2799571 RepID=UPI001CC4681F|nr:hypothetical protein [Lactobacillus huangpiensis]